MKKKTKIIIAFLICLVIATSTVTLSQLKIIDFGLSLFSTQDTKENKILEEEIEAEPDIKNTPPTAYFTYSNDGYTVQFHEQSTDEENNALTYMWGFGDGVTSSARNPTHIYDCSETNVFDITLTVSDGEFNDAHTEHILFGSHLNIMDYSQIWTGYDSWEEKGFYEPVWFGDISMTVENTGNIPTEISYARIDSKERGNGYPAFSTKIYFNFTYTYDELIEAGNGNGLSSEIWMTFISNNTLTLFAGDSITLTSNPDLTYVMWGVGTYPVNIWLFEKIRGEDTSHTLHETVVELT